MSRRRGCLVLYGLGNTEYHVKPLTDQLKKEGFTVHFPELAGHGVHKGNMRSVTFLDWLTSAQKGFEKLVANCDEVHVIGFSMGGLLALNLAINEHVTTVTTINTPVYYPNTKLIFRNILRDIGRRTNKHTSRYLRARYVPISALRELKKLLIHTKNLLPSVTPPAYLIQAVNDDVVKNTSIKYLTENTGSEQVKTKYYLGGGHVLLRSNYSKIVIDDILQFIDMHSNP